MMLIKIGGGEQINLEATITDLAELEQPFIIVHGANVLRDQLGKRLGMEKAVLTSVSGYSSVFSPSASSCLLKVSYSSSGWPPLWQLPAPALKSVSPENSAGCSVCDNRQM